MKPFFSRLARVPKRAAEFMFFQLDLEKKNCMTSIFWGALVIVRDSFSYSPGSRVMVDLVAFLEPVRAEWVWGGFALLCGTMQFWAILRDFRPLRKAAALVNCGMWILFTVAILAANPHAAVLSTFGLFAWSSAALYHQLATGRRV